MPRPLTQLRTAPATPFRAAALSAARRQALPMTLDSAEYQRHLTAEVRDRAVWSAKVANADLLNDLSQAVTEIVGGPDAVDYARRAAGEGPLLTSLPEARLRLRARLDAMDYRPVEGEEGTIKDLRSEGRLNLMLDTNIAVAQNAGQFAAQQDPDLLEVWPCQELVRVQSAREPRNWAHRWAQCGGQTFGGRMIARKDSGVWSKLGDPELFPDALGNPFPPFAFSSGMDVRDVSRREAIELGVIKAEEAAPEPQAVNLHESMQVTADRWGAGIAEALASDPELRMEGDTLTLARTSDA